jgi:membrane fusion protein (multidrug efflux system)
LRSISPGTYITPAILVAKLVNTGKLKITFSIPEKYIHSGKTNTNITFTISDLLKNLLQKCMLSSLSEVAIATRTLQVRAITDNKNGKLARHLLM